MLAQVHESCTNCITSECLFNRYGIMDSVFSEEGSPRNFGRMKKILKLCLSIRTLCFKTSGKMAILRAK